MQPTHNLEIYLSHLPPELHDIVMELRSLVAAIAPHVSEVTQRGGFAYYYKERGGPVSAGVCAIDIRHDHVRLHFIHGAFLPDPLHLLEGSPRYKRFVRLYSYEQTPWDALHDLIQASARFDPRTLSPSRSDAP